MFSLTACAALMAASAVSELALPPVRTAAEATALAHADYANARPFELRGRVVAEPRKGVYVLEDATGRTTLITESPSVLNLNIRGGDIIVARGNASYYSNIYDQLQLLSAEIVGHAEKDAPVPVSGADVASGACARRVVSVTGTVTGAYQDEIDDNYCYLVLDCDRVPVVSSVPRMADAEDWMRSVARTTVRVTGLCLWNKGRRKMLGWCVRTSSTNDIEVLKTAGDPFATPELEPHAKLSVRDLEALGMRKLVGKVLVRKGARSILIRDAADEVHRADLALGESVPPVGSAVMAAGKPATDLYRVNLTEATVRMLPDASTTATSTNAPIGESEMFAILARPGGAVGLYGQSCRVRGTVRDVEPVGTAAARICLACRGGLVAVDTDRPVFTASQDFPPGSTVEARGIFATDQDNARPDMPFPQIRGWSLVLQNPDDARVLVRPPWWTPGRLAAALGVLFAMLCGFAAWNRFLSRLVAKRSRELLDERIASIGAQLRVDERTRLAAELHDSLSQNLSGIACQVNAAMATAGGDPETHRLLATAERMLLSCRTELTRCIWDLRGDTLEEADFTTAIRKTLAPLALPAAVHVRFNVPRAMVSDSTAHNILCIVRELVTNAAKHGKADGISVAGEIHDGQLSFSVRDDGCGFDPARRPGVADGHFGLAGIRDRVNHLDGTFDLVSAPGAGTKARVSLRIPKAAEGTASAI